MAPPNNDDNTASTMNYALVSGAVVDVGQADVKKSRESSSSLVSIFEGYAQQYPNPRLVSEHEQRDALLQQVAAQQAALNEAAVPPKKKKSGLFGFLWSKKPRHDKDTDGRYDTSNLKESEWLEYHDTDDEYNENTENTSLCDSTMLDVSCIPQEAYSAARFHLSCRRNVPNVARNTTNNSSIVTLIEVGVICQVLDNESVVMETNDKQALREYIHGNDYDVSRARAVVLGADLLAVTWGFQDGIVVFYQRHEHSWDSIAIISPTRAVSDNLEHAHHSMNDDSMLVTDLVAMQVQDPNDVDGVVTTLAVSRLGGYVEFIVLPRQLLSGSFHPRKHRLKRKRGSEHYAADLPNISFSDTGMTALTTADYHVDVMCMEAYRTNVTTDTEWDMDVFPKTPPAEYVLAASGGTNDGTQVISFWGVSIVFPEDASKESAASIHVTFLEGINLGAVGANVTLFASEKMKENWRRPRRVRLKVREEESKDAIMSSTENSMDEVSVKHKAVDDTTSSPLVGVNLESTMQPLSTLSTCMPIVRMRLASTKDSQSQVLLAALDGNGGVTFVDCMAVIALAAHDVAEDSLGDDDPLLKMKCMFPPTSLSAATVDIGWLDAEAAPSEVDHELYYEDGCSPSSFSLVAVKPRMLQVVRLPQLAHSDSTARVSYSLDLPSVSHGATVIGSSPGQCITIVAFKTTESRRKLLCQGNLERLDSSTVLIMLVKAAKYVEAIAAAEAMNIPTSSDTIQLCHKKLWERDGDVSHLAAVVNDGYVVKETLKIFDESNSRTEIDLAAARASCLLALDRVNSEEGADEVKLRLEALEAKVSTYILLCMRNEAIPQLTQFREKFLPTSLRQLASAFASRGDMSALSMILFRHRPELIPCQLKILDRLPLETPPESFAHLMPVSRPGESCFHTGEHGIDGLRQWSMMAHYMESTYGIRLLLDDKDEAAILDRCRLFDGEESVLQAASIQEWYLTRAKRVQSEIGSVSLLRDFFELASQRLGVPLDTISGGDADPELHELSSMYTYALQLNRILTDASSVSTSEKLASNALATMSLSEIEKMSVDDRISLILGPPDDPSAVLSKFKNGAMFLTLGEQTEGEQCERTIDSALSVYCGKAISNSIGENVGNGSRGPQQADGLRNALDVCTEIANASRSTIRRSNRVVKDKTILMNLVLSAAYDTSRACKLIDLLPSDCRHMIESMWESYECLPARLSPDEALENNLQTEVDGLYSNLVVVDIFSRWSPCALRFLVDLLRTEYGEGSRDRRVEVGLTILADICRSFCHQTGQTKGSVASEAELNLLRELMSDIDQLQKVGFDETLPMASTLQESLIKPLLQQEKFHLIDPLANWINREEVQAAVLAFVNEAMFTDDDTLAPVRGMVSGDSVQAAINCQDILGPSFPVLQAEFESSRRYLDAANFMNRMTAGSNEFTYPCEVRDKPPLDIIESVMTRKLGCILDGCREWSDPTFSRRANETIRGHYLSMRQGNTDVSSPGHSAALPILPGSAIYHLASLLGLQGPHSMLVVKARVVFHAILSSEFAAAAAVCATMVYETNDSSWDDPAFADCVVDAVARVVSLNQYDDLQMKLALCNGVFQRDRNKLSVVDCRAYETVLDSFVMLENMISRRQRPQESAVDSPGSDRRASQAQSGRESPTFLVFRAVGMVAKTAKNVARHAHQPTNQSAVQIGPPPSLSDRVYQDILAQYSTDIRNLFWILRGVSASSRVDDPLLLTLGRLIGFWCIADALRMRPQSLPLEPERADLEDVLALGMSLLLHTQDREALVSCIGELQGILARETVVTMERAASVAQPDSVAPDPEIVRSLISRGYSENGARRAAVMTGNESAQVALVWAVSHTLDEGFDDPMVSVASPSGSSESGRVDQSMLHCLQETLDLANSYVSRKQTLQSLLPATQSLTKLLTVTQTRSIGEEDTHQNGHGQKATNVSARQKLAAKTSLPSKSVGPQEGKSSLDRIYKAGAASDGRKTARAQPSAMAIDKSVVPAKPPLVAPNAAQLARSDKQSVGTITAKPKLAVPPAAPTGGAKASPVVAGSSSVAARKVVPSKPMAAPPTDNKLPRAEKPAVEKPSVVAAPTKPKPTVPPPSVPPSQQAAPRSLSTPAVSSATAAPKVPSASVDRLSTLRSHNKSTGTKLASDERQRLIAEGRRMLREARASRASTATKASSTAESTDSSTTASTSRYPLRSRRTTASSGTGSTAQATAAASSNVAQAPKPAPAENRKQDEDDGWDFDDF